MKINKIIGLAVSTGVLAFSVAGVASAHVVVKPSDVRTGAYQTFSMGVAAERDSPTVSVKLMVPEDLISVRPTVKSGWTIQTDKQGEGEDAVITAITWTGGDIGASYRDEFTFSAKTPDHPMDLSWKAYQTYQDGTVVSWDQPDSGDTEVEGATSGPFSVTRVTADSDQDKALKDVGSKASNAQSTANKAFYAGVGGIIMAAIAIAMLIAHKPKVKVD